MTVYALNGLGRIGKLALKPLLDRFGADRRLTYFYGGRDRSRNGLRT